MQFAPEVHFLYKESNDRDGLSQKPTFLHAKVPNLS